MTTVQPRSPVARGPVDRQIVTTSVLFDLDGTLVDTLPGIVASAEAALQRVAPDRPTPDLRPLIGPPIREIFRRIIPELSPEKLEALVQAFRRHYDAEGWRLSRPYPAARGILGRLASWGMTSLVVTNKPSTPTARILAHLGLAPALRVVISPDSRMPPFASKQEMVAHGLAALDIDPAAALLVGDSTDDAAAAEACGIRFAAARYGYGQVQRQAAHPIHHQLDALGDLLHAIAPRRPK